MKTIKKILDILQKHNIFIYHKWMSPAVNYWLVKMKKEIGPFSCLQYLPLTSRGQHSLSIFSFLIQLVNSAETVTFCPIETVSL